MSFQTVYSSRFRNSLKRIRFHDLRYTCASLLLAGGVGVKDVQAHVGHASAQITLDVYGHLIPDGRSAGANSFEDGFWWTIGGWSDTAFSLDGRDTRFTPMLRRPRER